MAWFIMRVTSGLFEGIDTRQQSSPTGLPTRLDDAMTSKTQKGGLALQAGKNRRLVRDLGGAEPEHVRHAIGLLRCSPALFGKSKAWASRQRDR